MQDASELHQWDETPPAPTSKSAANLSCS